MLRNNFSNVFRHADGSDGFDFWNVRVVLPKERLFFYTMPYILSGAAAPSDRVGLWVYDGGNGGPSGVSGAAMEYIGADAWSAAREQCELRWSRAGETCCFGERRIRLVGPSARWDVEITAHLDDEGGFLTERRQRELIERMLLRRVPFIHKVPRMKGYATGYVEHQGCQHRFERAPLYQAKNHGRDFPASWIWIYANVFHEDDEFALEAAWLETTAAQPGVGMVRVARREGTRLLGTWLDDRIEIAQNGDDYTFRALARDRSLSVEGAARQGESVRFSFPAPNGGLFENNECLVGSLTAEIDGRHMTSNMAALGRARRVEMVPDGALRRVY
jgi:hypothetical protein